MTTTTRRTFLAAGTAIGATVTGAVLPVNAAPNSDAWLSRAGDIMGEQKATFVLVHGAWHSGPQMEGVAAYLRAAGHTVHTPTLAGNGPGDSKTTTLTQAINGLVDYFAANGVTDAVLYGHSYGGMPVTGAADRLPEGALRRLVYHSAFVPNDGESLEDLNPPAFNALFQQIIQPDGGLLMPYPIWREALMNDASAALAKATFETLNNHPHTTMTEKISLGRNAAAFPFGKSYIISQSDWGQPPSLGGWYQFTERLGLYRHVEMAGGHEVCFTDPAGLAEAILIAGRD